MQVYSLNTITPQGDSNVLSVSATHLISTYITSLDEFAWMLFHITVKALYQKD